MTIDLNREESLRIEQGTSIEVTCLSGVLWITQENDVRDLFLGPGESLRLRRPGLGLITALEPSALDIRDVRNVTVALQVREASWSEWARSLARRAVRRLPWPRLLLGTVTKTRAPVSG